MGGLRDRDARGRGRRRDDARRHAAQLRSRRRPRVAGARGEARGRATASARVDVGFWGGVVPGNVARARGRCVDAGVLGFKCFLVDSGVDEFAPRRRGRPRRRRCRCSRGSACRCSCTPSCRRRIDARRRALAGADPRRYATYLASRPPRGGGRGDRAARRAVPRRTRARVHIVHLSAASALPLLARARAPRACRSPPRPARTTCTSPPRTIPDGATAVQVRAADPRARRTARRSGRRSRDGMLDARGERSLAVHAGAEGAGERRLRRRAGAASPALQLGAARRVDRGAARAATRSPTSSRWMCAAPGARSPGSRDARARIAAGHDADLVVFDRRRASTVEPERCSIATRSRRTPGATLRGVVHATCVRGQRVYARRERHGALAARLLRSDSL